MSTKAPGEILELFRGGYLSVAETIDALDAVEGYVSVELLNIERAISDDLRGQNAKLREAAAAPAVGGEALPTYGSLPWDQLGLDVNEAMTGERFAFQHSGYPGHSLCPINFNSLARIIDKYRVAAPPTSSETPNSLLEKWAGWKVRAGRSRGCGMSELGDYRRLVEKPMIDRYESEIASLHSENERLQDALQQAINVFDGMNDDEINVELLPRLRAALNNKRGLAVHGHGQNRDKTREDVERALAPPASPLRGSDSVQQALEPFAKIGLDVLKNHAGWANDLFAAHWAGYCLTYLDFERAAAVARTLTASRPEQPAADREDKK